MSSSFANFADKNPFEDPAVLEALRIEQTTSNVINLTPSQNVNQAVEQAINQAILGPPPPYSSPTSYDPNAADELRRKQEELERKAAELQRREEEMQRNVQQQGREKNNFPPLPSFCPLKSCFYQDISIDIPLQFQNIVKMGYRLWLGYILLLLINTFVSMIYMASSISNEISNQSYSTFGLSILILVLLVPCSFVCWFRPLYNAFRIDSSFNFFFFFFIFFFQFIVSVFQALGISGWGTVGIVSSISMMSHGTGGSLFAGLLMLLVGLLFAALAIMDFLLLIKVHRIFRSSGATFAKAQQEFAQDIMGNRTLQQAATNLISSNTGAGSNPNNRY